MLVRIGTLSEQTGMSADVLRSWERRYGLLTPGRTAGGFRLYTNDDLRRVMLMKDLIAAGVSPAEAARQVLTLDNSSPVEASLTGLLPADECRVVLAEAFRSFSEASLEGAVDLVLARLDLDSAIREVFIPCLRDLGSDWAEGRVTIGQEHVAVNALRGRLMGLSRGWDRGLGPRVVLACPPGDHHDISLVLFGLALHQRGWRVTFLGADTPIETVAEVCEALAPRLVVFFSAQWAERTTLASSLAQFSSISAAIAGSTGEAIAAKSGLRWLSHDPVTEAESLTHELGRPWATP